MVRKLPRWFRFVALGVATIVATYMMATWTRPGPDLLSVSTLLKEEQALYRPEHLDFHNSVLLEFSLRHRNDNIPRIIHQLARTKKIHLTFVPFVQSWRVLHPKWTYMFWTHHDARLFITENYPDFKQLSVIKNTTLFEQVARYFILHHYGGVFADLSMRALKPMDSTLLPASCVLSYEPSAVSKLISGMPILATPSWMACSPGHLVTLQVISRSLYSMEHEPDSFVTPLGTGSPMLQFHITFFEGSKSFLCDSFINCDLFVVDHRSIIPNLSPDFIRHYPKMCAKENLTELETEGCDELAKNQPYLPSERSYTLYEYAWEIDIDPTVDVQTVVEDITWYESESIRKRKWTPMQITLLILTFLMVTTLFFCLMFVILMNVD